MKQTRLGEKSYAFVLPRYFAGLAGGAETLAAALALQLSNGGHKVEIFTTCARDNRTWENAFSPGRSVEGGLIVNRYPVNERDLEVWIPKQISISQGMRLSLEDQLEWMKEGVNSDELYQALLMRQHEFDNIFFAPYLFSLTFWGSLLIPEKAVLIPCLHDEIYAYLEVSAAMFRRVGKALFNSLPEMELAKRLYGKLEGGEVGMGFEPFTDSYLESLSGARTIPGPYILYMGRKETGKGVDLLIDYFITAKESYQLDQKVKLVIAGGGDFKDLHRGQASSRDDIIDVEHIPEREKHALMRNALLFCQPSVNESFSIVIMESWLLGVPCLVNGQCAVTSYHARESGGGLYFENEAEFAETVKLLLSRDELRDEMAAGGYRYVREKYNWPAVLKRFNSVMAGLSLPLSGRTEGL